MPAVPVIDLFAGPGGLGEGFSQEPSADFRIAVSIEKDPMAFETLRLRAVFRELRKQAGERNVREERPGGAVDVRSARIPVLQDELAFFDAQAILGQQRLGFIVQPELIFGELGHGLQPLPACRWRGH